MPDAYRADQVGSPLPAYRADQVGSLLRPSWLLDARQQVADGTLSADDLSGLEDRAIREALSRQEALGLDVVTDGEFRRASWLTGMADAVDGFVPDHVELTWKGPGGGVEPTTARVVGARLRKRHPLTEQEVPFLVRHARTPVKVTLPAPSNFMLSSYKDGVTDAVYATRRELLAEIVDIVRDEVRWLVARGVSYVQLDAPYYSHYLDPHQREHLRGLGHDPDGELSHVAGADGAALADAPPGKVIRALHVCRGNNQSRWYTEGAYDAVAEQLFGNLDVDRFLLEYDDERSGGFEPLRFVPEGKTAVLGLVTSKRPDLETVDDLRRRIDEASRVLPLDRLALSPQCGFASIAAGNRLSIEEQWKKLARVVETARQVWDD